MAFDYTTLTAQNCPWRWTLVSKHLRERDPAALAGLDSNYQNVMNYIYDNDWVESRVPTAPTSVGLAPAGPPLTVEVSWPEVIDADTYTIYWMHPYAGETAAQVIAAATTQGWVIPGVSALMAPVNLDAPPSAPPAPAPTDPVGFTVTASDAQGESPGAPPEMIPAP